MEGPEKKIGEPCRATQTKSPRTKRLHRYHSARVRSIPGKAFPPSGTLTSSWTRRACALANWTCRHQKPRCVLPWKSCTAPETGSFIGPGSSRKHAKNYPFRIIAVLARMLVSECSATAPPDRYIRFSLLSVGDFSQDI